MINFMVPFTIGRLPATDLTKLCNEKSTSPELLFFGSVTTIQNLRFLPVFRRLVPN